MKELWSRLHVVKNWGFFHHLDIDECSGSYMCPDNATCSNTVGSYTCLCNVGFATNGSFCKGTANINTFCFNSATFFQFRLTLLSCFLFPLYHLVCVEDFELHYTTKNEILILRKKCFVRRPYFLK